MNGVDNSIDTHRETDRPIKVQHRRSSQAFFRRVTDVQRPCPLAKRRAQPQVHHLAAGGSGGPQQTRPPVAALTHRLRCVLAVTPPV